MDGDGLDYETGLTEIDLTGENCVSCDDLARRWRGLDGSLVGGPLLPSRRFATASDVSPSE